MQTSLNKNQKVEYYLDDLKRDRMNNSSSYLLNNGNDKYRNYNNIDDLLKHNNINDI